MSDTHMERLSVLGMPWQVRPHHGECIVVSEREGHTARMCSAMCVVIYGASGSRCFCHPLVLGFKPLALARNFQDHLGRQQSGCNPCDNPVGARTPPRGLG